MFTGGPQPLIIPIPHDPRIMGSMSQAYSLVDLGKRLLDSAKNGDVDEVRALMTNGAPFTTDWLGSSPLHFAAMNGHYGTCEVLLRAGISRDARTKVDRTPLHLAAQEGHADIVELLVRNGADIEAKDMLKMTALHWAAERGHSPVIAVLLKYGGDPEAVNKFVLTPLEIAHNKNYSDAVQTLQRRPGPSETAEMAATEYLIVDSTGDAQGMPAPEVEVTIGGDENTSMTQVEEIEVVDTDDVDVVTVNDGKSDEQDDDNEGGIIEQLVKLSEEADGGEIQIQGLPLEMSATETVQFLESQGLNIVSRALEGESGVIVYTAQARHSDLELELNVRHEPGVLSLTVTRVNPLDYSEANVEL